MITTIIISCIVYGNNGNFSRKEGKILLSHLSISKYTNYGFRFQEEHQNRVAGIYSVGWETQTKATYNWDGLTRSESDVFVFQYTLNGTGAIKIKEQHFDLKAGDAFFVKVPSEHRYFLPEESQEWEFIHLTLFGDEVERFYEVISENDEHVFQLPLDSRSISMIIDVLRAVSANQLQDAYASSSLAYSFIMELRRFLLNFKTNDEWPQTISRAISFIHQNYHQPISLDDIVDSSGLSKYHFTRLFHATIHATPIQYLTTIRLNNAITLLKNEQLTIEEIAVKVGFSNGNYFGKVFRSTLGISPGEYRNTKSFITVDHLIGNY